MTDTTMLIAAAQADVKVLQARIAGLEKLVYVPGLWKCAKCRFSLVQSNLNAMDGSVTARDEPGEKCPNGCGPLWRVTERDAGNEMVDRCEEQVARAVAVEAAQARIIVAVAPFVAFAKATERMLTMDPDHKITQGSPMAAPQLYARDFLALLAALNREMTA